MHRMIGAAMAELQLVSLAAAARGRESGGRGRCRRSASCRSACGHCRPACASGSGSPGPFERKTPSGLSASTSSAEVSAGTTVTRQPDVHQPAQNVLLDAEIVGDHVKRGSARAADQIGGRAGFDRLGPFVALRRGDAAGEIEAGHGGNGARLFDQLLRRPFRWPKARRASRRGCADGAPARAYRDRRRRGCRLCARKPSASSSERQLLVMRENSRTTSPSI